MKLALGFNPVLPLKAAAAVAAKAEASGYDSVWMHESLFQRDVVTYISAMAAATNRIRIGSGVMNTFTRHPVTAATTFATLSELSGGRVVLGLGLGSFPTVPLLGYDVFPVDRTKPLRRIKEYVEVVRAVWKGGRVEFEGEFFKVHNLTLGFELKAPVPVFVASLSPKTLAFAGREADGAILSPALNTVRGTERMVANVKAGESARGRTVERASYLLTSLDPDQKKARDAVRDYYFFVFQLSDVVKPEALEPYGVSEKMLKPMKEAYRRGDIAEAKRLVPEAAVEALTVVGNADHAAERINEYVKAGVTLPILMPIGNVDHAVDAMAPGRS
jgi:5,10-methylenetetrahydromethanopterin reductase